MRYYVTIGDRTHEVSIGSDDITVDGQPIDAQLVRVPGTPIRRLSVDGASHRLLADHAGSRGAWRLHLDGFVVTADVVDERTRAIRAMTGPAAVTHGPRPVRAPMPGMVVRVEVAPGEHVKAGQGVVIIEAMKMENELKAETAATVAKVAVLPGTAVEKGAVLIEFAPDV